MSCAGNGYLSGNMLKAFPFEDGLVLPWRNAGLSAEAQIAYQRCFVDAGIYISGHSILDGGWPSVGMVEIIGSSMRFMVSANGASVEMWANSSGDGFPVIYGNAPWGSYVIVLSSEGTRDFIKFCIDKELVSPPRQVTPLSLGGGGVPWIRLCDRCVTVQPEGLSSIRVYDGVKSRESGPHFVLKGDVSVKPGNNVLLSEPDMDNGIQIDAVAGAGLGRIPCICDDESEKASPLVSPDGHTRFFNDTCYDLEPRIFTVEEDGVSKRIGKIFVHAKCTACCTCAMYESIVNDRLVPIHEAVKEARSKINEMLAAYEDGVKRFNSRISVPSMEDITMSLSGMPVGVNVGSKIYSSSVKGKMGRCAFTASIRNSSYLDVLAKINAIGGTDYVAEVAVAWSEDDDPKAFKSDSANGVLGRTFTIQPGHSMVVTFVTVKNDMSGNAGLSGYYGRISAGFFYVDASGTSRSIGRLEKSVEV